MSTEVVETLDFIGGRSVQTRLNQQEEQALLRVLRECDSLSVGSEGKALEAEFAKYVGSADAVALSNCSAALELASVLSGIGPDDEVILPAHTFVATAVPFARTGAQLRWADIDPDTCTIDARSVAGLITSKTRVIVAVHLYGLSANMDALLELADRHDIIVVEDCAQAPGARYKGRQVGSMGHFGCFSFHSQKNITTLGEGGMLTVRNKEHAVQARRMRWMGNWAFGPERKHYWKPTMSDVVEPIPGQWPFNYCMGEPNAAVGRMLLKRLGQISQTRRRQAARFHAALVNYPELSFQKVPADCEHVHHLMPARFDGQAFSKTRDDLIEILHDKYKLKCVVHYWPLNRTELFRKFGFGKATVPETDRFFDNCIGFPWWSDMSDEEIDEIARRTRCAIDDLRCD